MVETLSVGNHATSDPDDRHAIDYVSVLDDEGDLSDAASSLSSSAEEDEAVDDDGEYDDFAIARNLQRDLNRSGRLRGQPQPPAPPQHTPTPTLSDTRRRATRRIIQSADEDSDEDPDGGYMDNAYMISEDEDILDIGDDDDEDEEESDAEYTGGRRRPHTSARKRKAVSNPAPRRIRKKNAVPDKEPWESSEEEWEDNRPVRSSTRPSLRAHGPLQYKEEEVSDEDDSMEEADPHDAARYIVEKEEGDVIESLHDHRPIPDAPESFTEGYEFYVKWRGWSHRHDAWGTYAYLKDFVGVKRLDNYIRGVVGEEWRLRHDPSTTKEDLEHMDIKRELGRRQLVEYTRIERVIACRDGKDSKEYLCKWMSLPYAQVTWEPEVDVVSDVDKEAIRLFHERETARTVPHRSVDYRGKRPKYRELPAQPDYLGPNGERLRDYQLRGMNWFASRWARDGNGILADEMGLGKTVQTVSGLSYLFHERHQYGPFLVVVPLSTIGAWQREFARWSPDMNVVCYVGDAPSRRCIREYEFHSTDPSGAQGPLKFNVLLTTYELILKDRPELSPINWSFLAVDEAHRLKNTESQLHETLVSSYHHANRLLITGTPMQNNLQELYALLHFLSPREYPSHLAPSDDAEGGEARIRELREALGPLMLRRVKRDVESSMPKKVERILRVELSPLQSHYYRAILARNFAALNGKGGSMSLLNVAMELKKAANHPFLFPGAEADLDDPSLSSTAIRHAQLQGIIRASGKMVLLDKLLTRLRANGHRVLIFSQMVRLLDILHDYLALRGYPHQRLDGSIGSEARKRAISEFNAPGSMDFAFLLSTRAGGLGLNLETADTVIIFDSDWNPQNDLQAMARAHRIGQTKEVHVYRLVSKGTIEEDVVERARRKMILEYCILQGQGKAGGIGGGGSGKRGRVAGWDKEEWKAMLKFGAQSLFQEGDDAQKASGGAVLEEMDLDDVLARAEERGRAEEVEREEAEAGAVAHGGAADFMQQFIVSDFQPSWEDIVPADQRGADPDATDPAKGGEGWGGGDEEERALVGMTEARLRRRPRHYYEDEGQDPEGGLGGPDGDGPPHRAHPSGTLPHGSKRPGEARRGGGVSDPKGSSKSPSSLSRSAEGGRAKTPRSRPRSTSGGRVDTLQRSYALSERDVRMIIRAVQRYGEDLNDPKRYDAIVSDARVVTKDPSAIREAVEELKAACVNVAEVAPATAARRGERAIPVVFRGVTVNAVVHLRRCAELSNLRAIIDRMGGDSKCPTRLLRLLTGEPDYVTPWIKPPIGWTPAWDLTQDAALALGIHRHGFGQWEAMAADKDLDLGSYMHLNATERTLLPKTLNIHRRADAVLRALQLRFPSDRLPLSEAQMLVCKEALRPVRHQLRWLQDESKTCEPAAKVRETTRIVLLIGRHISSRRRENARDPDLWAFVALFWPSFIQPDQLSALYEKLERRERESTLQKA